MSQDSSEIDDDLQLGGLTDSIHSLTTILHHQTYWYLTRECMFIILYIVFPWFLVLALFNKYSHGP